MSRRWRPPSTRRSGGALGFFGVFGRQVELPTGLRPRPRGANSRVGGEHARRRCRQGQAFFSIAGSSASSMRAGELAPLPKALTTVRSQGTGAFAGLIRAAVGQDRGVSAGLGEHGAGMCCRSRDRQSPSRCSGRCRRFRSNRRHSRDTSDISSLGAIEIFAVADGDGATVCGMAPPSARATGPARSRREADLQGDRAVPMACH